MSEPEDLLDQIARRYEPSGGLDGLLERAGRRRRRRRIGAATTALLLATAGVVFVGLAFRGSPHHGASGVACGPAPSLSTGPLGAVAYVRGDELHVVDLATRRDRVLVAKGGSQLADGPVRWSPDGRWIAYGNAIVVPAGGGFPCRPLGGDVVSWTWSPTSEVMAGMTHKGGLVVGGPGMSLRQLRPSGWGAPGFRLVFDPTGRFLAVGRFLYGPGSGVKDEGVWVLDVQSGQAREIYRTPKGQDATPIVEGWSPEGRWVLFWSDPLESSSLAQDGLQLEAVSASGGPAVEIAKPVLTYDDFLSWCGDRLVVAVGGYRDVTQGKGLVVASPPDWQPTDLSKDNALSWIWPACSPDGQWVAATAGHPLTGNMRYGSEYRTIWLLSTSGSTRADLVGTGRGRWANEFSRWSADGRSILFVRRVVGFGKPASLYLARLDPLTGRLLSVDGPIADLGGSHTYYGYYAWSLLTDWLRPARG